MPWNPTDRSFKTLINKRTTDSTGKFYYNEVGDFTINTHASEIWYDTIPGTPPGATTSVVEVRTLFVLTEDTSVPSQGSWFASTDGTESGRLKNWISDKYNAPGTSSGSYAVHLFDKNGTEISPVDGSGWFFDYQTGILDFANGSTDSGTVSSRGPYKVTGFRYIGRKGVGTGTVTSVGGLSGIVTDLALSAPITGAGNLRLDLTYSPAWTGHHTFTQFPTLPSASPLNATDAASKGYVDSAVAGTLTQSQTDARYLQLSGGTLSGNLSFSLSAGQWGLTTASLTTASLPMPSSANTGAIVWDTNVGSLKVSTGTQWLLLASTTGNTTNVTGSGTTNTLPLWANSTGALADSLISESGSMIRVAGNFTAQTKSFTIPHPTKQGKNLVYGSLEGPEHGAYHRGVAAGTGRVRVELPDYWPALVGEDYTVHLTAYGDYQLYVAERGPNWFIVVRSGWWFSRRKTVEFSYMAVGSRSDAPLVTEQEQ